MRILVFSTDDFLPPAGGAETAFGEIAKRLPDVEFDLVCARLRRTSSSGETAGNVRIHRVGFGIPKLDGVILALTGARLGAKLHKQNRYDLVWSILASYGGFAAVQFKQKTGVPFLLTLQEGSPSEQIVQKTRLFQNRFRNIFRQADGLQSISSYLDKWGHGMGFHGKLAKVVPNGVDLAAFTATFSDDDIKQCRDAFGFPPGSIILITTSRLVEKNGVKDIVTALPMLHANVCLVICGDGAQENELRKMVSDLGLERRVIFLGFVARDRLPLLLKASDIFIRPSLSEGFGNSFIEAMAAGIPVIGTDVGGIKDYLVDGMNGFVCKPSDPASIAETVRKTMQLAPGSEEALILRASKMVRERYDWNIISNSMMEIFNQLISTEHGTQ